MRCIAGALLWLGSVALVAYGPETVLVSVLTGAGLGMAIILLIGGFFHD